MKKLRGNILPLALVMTLTILLSGVTLGVTIVNNLERSANTDDSVVAYYASDSGVERQLYAVRKENASIADTVAMSGTFANGSSWVSTDASRFVSTNVKTFASLDEETFQFVDLFDPDTPDLAGGVGKVIWTWDDGGTPFCEVEMGYSEWDTTNPTIIPSTFTVVFGQNGSGTYNLDPSSAYRLRFRPNNCDVTNLQIRVYDAPSSVTPMTFPGDITIAAEGVFKKTKQAIAVTMPRLDILSGVFTYVIFSECTLYKDALGSSPACP